jgi:hypothetical protein
MLSGNHHYILCYALLRPWGGADGAEIILMRVHFQIIPDFSLKESNLKSYN